MNNSKTRKASDIILELEAGINQLLSLVKAQDLNIKIMSNKLNLVMEQLKEKEMIAPQEPKFTVSASDGSIPKILLDNRISEQEIINSNESLPITDSPVGFRRTSRPETFTTIPTPLHSNQNIKKDFQAPVAQPKTDQKLKIEDPSPPRMQDLKTFAQQQNILFENQNKQETQESYSSQKQNDSEDQEFVAFENKNQEKTSNVSVTQRIIDKNGKSVFLAEVSVIDQNNNVVYKTRTNGVGKWIASLSPGKYTIKVNKRESLSKEKIEANQNVVVSGNLSQVALEQLIVQ